MADRRNQNEMCGWKEAQDMKMTKKVTVSLVATLTLMLGWAGCSSENAGPVRKAVSNKETYQEAYVYAFPMIAAYKVT